MLGIVVHTRNPGPCGSEARNIERVRAARDIKAESGSKNRNNNTTQNEYVTKKQEEKQRNPCEVEPFPSSTRLGHSPPRMGSFFVSSRTFRLSTLYCNVIHSGLLFSSRLLSLLRLFTFMSSLSSPEYREYKT